MARLTVDQLLTTKLYIPQRSAELVPRPRLYERLDESLMRKLTLVSASAGFGKSTLVASWLVERGQPAAWLSLDQGDMCMTVNVIGVCNDAEIIAPHQRQLGLGVEHDAQRGTRPCRPGGQPCDERMLRPYPPRYQRTLCT